MKSGRQPFHGTPIEEAPLWVLAILTALLWLIVFPALIGLLHGFGLWRGDRLDPALAAGALALALVVGLATRKPWRRPGPGELVDRRPFFARFSAWLIGVVLYPNVLMGTILLTRPGPPPDYLSTAALGLLLSAVQGILAWNLRRRERSDNRDRPS
jgi:hypothetical protein